jgi:hypothetical protein
MAVLRTFPTVERGRSDQISTCLGAFTLPIRVFHCGDQLGLVGRGVRVQLHDGDHPLAPLVVGHPDDAAVAD